MTGAKREAPGPRRRRARLAARPVALPLGRRRWPSSSSWRCFTFAGTAQEPARPHRPTASQDKERHPPGRRDPAWSPSSPIPVRGQVAFSPDGKTLATVSETTVSTPLEHPAVGPGLRQEHGDDCRAGHVNGLGPGQPDTRHQSPSSSGPGVQLWDAATGKFSAQFSTPPGTDWPVDSHQPGRSYPRVGVQPFRRGHLLGPAPEPPVWHPPGNARHRLRQVPALAFSHDGTTLAAAGYADTQPGGAPVSLWNLATHQLVTTLHGPMPSGSIGSERAG